MDTDTQMKMDIPTGHKTHYESEHAYLVEKGLAKPGKGRRSKEAHEAIAKAIESGITFGKTARVKNN